MKKIIWGILTIGVILLMNWGVAALFHNDFMDWLFLSGLLVTILIAFFTSSGGFLSDLTDARLQSGNNDGNWAATEVRTKIDRQERHFHRTTSFYVALGYTIMAAIISIFYYKDYFIN